MDEESLKEIAAELEPVLVGRTSGKIFQLTASSLAIDFGLREHGYLLISTEPVLPRLHFIKRRVRDLEKQSIYPTQFPLTLKKELSNTRIITVAKDADDRIVRFRFAGEDDLGNPKRRELIAQLTGRSANLFLIDDTKSILQALRATNIVGQRAGDIYQAPSGASQSVSKKEASQLLQQMQSEKYASPSEAADAYFTSLLAQREFTSRAAAAHSALRKKVSQQKRLLKQLETDLKSHAEFVQHQRLGDLLLANVATAKREGKRVTLIDYFANGEAIQIEVDESESLPEAAAREFAAYAKSKRATAQVSRRIKSVRNQLRDLESQRDELERVVSEVSNKAREHGLSAERIQSNSLLERWNRELPRSSQPVLASGQKTITAKRIPGTRRYVSSDGFEILVGRTSRDNDQLTFKVAKPNDLWLHAADYGGSHVVVRNSSRKPLPHRTLIEAAQLAAYFSQAKKNPKVDVHYVERKFVTKPKGAKPGLVRLQRFKNITVKPAEAATREK